jgi:hypothetical protein
MTVGIGVARVSVMPRISRVTLLAAACLWVATTAAAQQQSRSIDDIAAQVRELRTLLDTMRDQLADSRRESEELRRELQAVREQLPQAPPRAQIDALAEEADLLRAKVEDLEQTKIESGSKHHVRLSGLVLLNVASTSGSVDSLDLPGIAQPRPAGESGGSLSAGVRQSHVGLEVFGPTLGGARTAGDLTFDFFGGLPGTPEGVSAPFVRLRTATFTMDWKNASILAGQDVPFFSPRSPTSLASTAYPALSAAGNLWAWTTQLHVDHRIALPNDSTLTMQWGVLDPLTGELPDHEYNRVATAGERSHLPAQAIRVSWQRGVDARLVAVGAGAYHASQDWGFGRDVHAWAATTDWAVALGPRFAVSGELYRGRALGGLGGGASESVLFDGPATVSTSSVVAVDSAGGWSQLKFTPLSRIEFNAAYGEDNPFRTGLSRLLTIGSVDASAVNRNASAFLNAIYQARSNLLFSVEYRRLWTTSLDDVKRTANHVSFSTGIGF